VCTHVFSFLPIKKVLQLTALCTFFLHSSYSDILWKTYYKKKYPNFKGGELISSSWRQAFFEKAKNRQLFVRKVKLDGLSVSKAKSVGNVLECRWINCAFCCVSSEKKVKAHEALHGEDGAVMAAERKKTPRKRKYKKEEPAS
jgi:hypothetical protein